MEAGLPAHHDYQAPSVQKPWSHLFLPITSFLSTELLNADRSTPCARDYPAVNEVTRPSMTYNFALGKLPVATTFRWFHEFDVENHLEGDGVNFTATIPLGGARAAKQ